MRLLRLPNDNAIPKKNNKLLVRLKYMKEQAADRGEKLGYLLCLLSFMLSIVLALLLHAGGTLFLL